MDDLSELQQLTIRMHYHMRMPFRTIAKELSITIGKVNHLLRQSRAILGHRLAWIANLKKCARRCTR